MTCTPFYILFHLVYGELRLSEQSENGIALKYLSEIDLDEYQEEIDKQTGFYNKKLVPLCSLLNRPEYKQTISHITDHLSEIIERVDIGPNKYERFVKPMKIQQKREFESRFGKTGLEQKLIRNIEIVSATELDRIFNIVNSLIEAAIRKKSSDSKINLEKERITSEEYDIREIIEFLKYILSGTGVSTNEEASQKKSVPLFIECETSALLEEIRLRATIAVEEQDFVLLPGSLALEKISGSSRIHRTSHWYNYRLKTILDMWTPKYMPDRIVRMFIDLYDSVQADIARFSNTEDVPAGLRQAIEHVQMVLFMMLVRHINTDSVKMGVDRYHNAKKQMRHIEQLIRFGGDNPKESSKLFDWHDKLEEADLNFEISRLPFLKERMNQINEVLKYAFASKISENQVPDAGEDADKDGGALAPAIEQMQHQFLTLKQLADYYGITDKAIRENLKKHNIPSKRFGGQTLVPYAIFKEKLEL